MNQTCPSSKTLGQFLNEELSVPLSNEVALHLESCTTCQAWCETHTEAMGTPFSDVGSATSEKILEDLCSATIGSAV